MRLQSKTRRISLIILFAALLASVVLPSFAVADAPPDWEKLKHNDRKEYMKHTVFPKMKELFGAFDPKDYANMKCKLCHGAGVTDDSYKMPNPKLPKIPATQAAFEKWKNKHSKMVDFMHDKVVPTMAGLLGKDHDNPKSTNKFGCLNCHTKKE